MSYDNLRVAALMRQGVTDLPAFIPGRPIRADGGYSRRASRGGPTSPPARAVAPRGERALSEPLVPLAPPPPGPQPAFGSVPAAERPLGRVAHAQSAPNSRPSGRYRPHCARPTSD